MAGTRVRRGRERALGGWISHPLAILVAVAVRIVLEVLYVLWLGWAFRPTRRLHGWCVMRWLRWWRSLHRPRAAGTQRIVRL